MGASVKISADFRFMRKNDSRIFALIVWSMKTIIAVIICENGKMVVNYRIAFVM